jgi:hypothetical protein
MKNYPQPELQFQYITYPPQISIKQIPSHLYPYYYNNSQNQNYQYNNQPTHTHTDNSCFICIAKGIALICCCFVVEEDNN